MARFTSNPSEHDPSIWIVWNVDEGLPPSVVSVGSMEQCSLVADALNEHATKREREAARAQEG